MWLLRRQPRKSPFDSLLFELKRNYSFTELKGIDWDALAERFRGPAEVAKSPEEFANAILPMLAELQDIHVWIEVNGERLGTHRSYRKPNYDAEYLPKQLSDLFEAERIGYCGRDKSGAGVVVVNSLPAEADCKPFLEAIHKLFDCPGMIVDIRANHGGSEPLAARIAGVFADTRVKYSRAKRRSNVPPYGMIEVQSQYLDPDPRGAYQGPVVCLIGPGCVSSGEGFAKMMKSLPRVTVIGQPTRGASGNPRPVKLSNGVSVWYSSWLSMELDGTPIEGRGVQPEEFVAPSKTRDTVFDQAIDLLSLP